MGNCAHSWKHIWRNRTDGGARGGFRICTRCNEKQWHLGCWTGDSWMEHSQFVIRGGGAYWRELKNQYGHYDLDDKAVEKMLAHMPQHLIRQWDVVPQKILFEEVWLVGLGGIGSWVGLALSKMGFDELVLYDFDNVAIENAGTQLYGATHVNKFKVDSFIEIASLLSVGEKRRFTPRTKWTSAFMHEGVALLMVDTMEMRAQFFKEQTKYCAGTYSWCSRWLFDARMSAEEAHLYIIDLERKEDRDFYAKTLYTDAQAAQEPCTARATVYTGMMIAGLICKTVKDVLAGIEHPRMIQWDIKHNDLETFFAKDAHRPQQQQNVTLQEGRYIASAQQRIVAKWDDQEIPF